MSTESTYLAVDWVALRDPLFFAVIDTTEDAVIGTDPTGVVKLWNRSAERIFGYTAAEAIGRLMLPSLIPSTRSEEETHLRETLLKGEPVSRFETIRRRKDGSYVGVSIMASPVKIDGKVLGTLRVLRDVSAEQRAVEDLRRSEERYRVTLSSIGDAVIATDTSGLVTYMNAVAEQLTGWAQQEARLQPLDKVFPLINEETRRAIDNPVARVIREGVIVGLANHTVLIARDGTERPIKDSAAPIRGSGGALSGVVLVFHDVTEERRAEITAEKLASIVEDSNDAIISKDINGLITSWNRAAERIFGYRATEVVGRPINLIIPPDRQDEEHQILARLRRGERVDHFETVRVTKDGRQLQVSLTISPIKDAEGHVVGSSKIARVIQERSG